MSKRKEILKQAWVYSLGSQAAQLITMVAAFLTRRFLGPAQMGIWSTLQILVDYSKYSTLGIMDSVTQEIPYQLGKGKTESAEQIKNIAFTVVLSGSFMIAAGICLFAVLTRGRFAPEVTNGLFLVSGIIFLQRINNLLISLLRCYKDFTLATRQMVLSALLNAVLVAFLTYFFKIYGFIFALGLSLLFNILFILFHRRFRFRIYFDTARFRSLVTYGLPLMLIGMLMTVLRSADKIVIVKKIGFEALGFYSIALMAAAYIDKISVSVGIVLIPHFQERFGRHDNPRDLKEYVLKSSYAYALTLPAIIGTAWILSPFLISLLLPKYMSGISALRFLTLSMFFTAIAQPYQDFLITIRKQWILFPLLLIICAITFLANLWVIHQGYGITGVAVAANIIYGIYFALMFFPVCHYVADETKPFWRHFFLFTGAYFYLALSLMAILHWVPAEKNSLPRILTQLSVFFVAYLPFLAIFDKKFSFFAALRNQLFQKFSKKKPVPHVIQ